MKTSTNIQSPDALPTGLVQQVQAGNRQAFATLYQQYGLSVFRTAYFMLGDVGRAEDVTQEVFLQVYKSADTYMPEKGAFTTWLHRITVNRCLNARRHRFLAWFSLDRPALEQSVPATTATPLDQVLKNEFERDIWQAVQQLPLKLRAVVVLRYYHDLSYEAIAEVLGCAVGTVSSRLHAAHCRLRSTLKD